MVVKAGRIVNSSPGLDTFEKIVPGANVIDFRAFYVGATGDIDVTDGDDTDTDDVVVIAGTIIPFAFKKIRALNNNAIIYGIK